MFLSFAIQSDINTQGLQHKVSGKYSKGKTDLCRAVIAIIGKKHAGEFTLSDKSVYYDEGIHEGHIIFSDDVKLSPGLEGIIKRASSDFQNPQVYNTIDANLKPVTMIMPSRIVWLLTGVENTESNELLSRCIQTDIDDSRENDHNVLNYIKKRANLDDNSVRLPQHDLEKCHDIFNDIKSKYFEVNIPTTISNEIKMSGRREAKMILDHIRGYAILDYNNRDKTVRDVNIPVKKITHVVDKNGAVYRNEYSLDTKTVECIRIDANMDDVDRTHAVYGDEIATTGLKLTKREHEILDILPYSPECATTTNDIQKATGMSQTFVSHTLHGRKNRGSRGLCERVDFVMFEERNCSLKDMTTDITTSTRKYYYWRSDTPPMKMKDDRRINGV